MKKFILSSLFLLFLSANGFSYQNITIHAPDSKGMQNWAFLQVPDTTTNKLQDIEEIPDYNLNEYAYNDFIYKYYDPDKNNSYQITMEFNKSVYNESLGTYMNNWVKYSSPIFSIPKTATNVAFYCNKLKTPATSDFYVILYYRNQGAIIKKDVPISHTGY